MRFLRQFSAARLYWAAGAFCLAVSALAPALAAAAPAGMDKIAPRHYICYDHNVHLPVTYIETAGGNFYAVLQAEGKLISMARREAAAAAGKSAAPHYYYLSLDEQNSYRWYPEGDSGRLSFLAADDGAAEQTVYQYCKLAKGN